MIIELCGQSLYDAIQAEQFGIHRMELNAALELGGLSPYLGILHAIKSQTKIKVIAMLRLRAGSFVYSEREMQEIEAMADALLEGGADGLAFGALQEDLAIEKKYTRRIVDKCKQAGAEFVFHRAFDTQNEYKAVETLIELGVDRLLTSGMQTTAWEGRDNLKRMQAEYGKYIEILAGSGVNPNNIKQIAEYTGVQQFHGSFSREVKSTSHNAVNFGSYLQADVDKLQTLSALMK